MKALKEKRVSLRSLFRRGLVILSLLALVFAVSCSGSGGGSYDDGYDDGYQKGIEEGGGSTVKLPPIVTSMTVLSHPINRSFEGAAPDLTGLSVMITIDDNGVKSIATVGPEDFQVEPPVAYITTRAVAGGGTTAIPATTGAAGVSDTDVSPSGRYQIRYVDSKKVNLNNAPLVNVYIPTVVAMDRLGFTGAAATAIGAAGTDTAQGFPGRDFGIIGTLGTVYEDQPIDASGVQFRARYVAIPGATGPTGTMPVDLGRTSAQYDWSTTNAAEGRYSNKVSSSALAWKIAGKAEANFATAKPAQYIYQPATTALATLGVTPAAITDYYYVEKLVYKSGASRIAKVNADDVLFNEAALTVNGAAIGTASRRQIQDRWLAKLVAAKVEFDVVYYRAGLESTGQKTRSIGMDDYIRAMWTTNAAGVARATLPIPSGVTHSGGDSYSVMDAFYPDELNYALRLFYYDERIENGAGAGNMAQTSASWPNAAIINITQEGLIWQYREILARRCDSTSYMWQGVDIGGIPDIMAPIPAGDFATAMERYYDNLKTHWEIGYIYENPLDTTKTEFFKIAWPAFNVANFDVTASDFDDIDTEEIRSLTITFDEPLSVGGVPGAGGTEWEFEYRVLP